MRPVRVRRLSAAPCLFLSLAIVIAALLATPSRLAAATLTGRVADPDRRPVAGARIVAETSFGAVAECTTDERGACTMSGLPASRYAVHVIASGFQADSITVAVTEEETRALDFPLHVSAVSESIVVSAAQIDVPLSRVADPITVLTAADLEARQVETVSDALRLVPGLTVTRTGGRGAITALFPRGGGSNYTLVLVDGMRANAFGGGFDFGHLAVADIDHVEIVRGPESALFGSEAIGAVVHIVTKRGGRPAASGFIEGGGMGTARAGVSASGSKGGWTWGGGAEQSRSSGFDGTAQGSGERVANDDDHLMHGSGTLGWSGPNGADVLVSANLTHSERGYPGPFGSDPIGVFPGIDRISRGVDNTRQVGARVGHPWSDRVRQRVDASYTDLSGEFTSPYGLASNGTHRFDGRVQEDVAVSGAFGASAGVEFLRESGTSTYITGPTADPLPIRRRAVGTFAELRYTGRDRLFATAGLRLEHLTRDAVAPSADPYAPRPAFPSQAVNSLNPKLAVSYLISAPGAPASTRLRASAGTGIRPPDAFEIAFTDNPNLRPERSRSLDAGIEQQFAGGAYVVSATAFYNRYDDLIVAVGRALRDASHFRTDNISNARATGLELTANALLTSKIVLAGTYTLIDSAVLSIDGLAGTAPAPFGVGDPLIRRPRHQGSFTATYRAGRFGAFLEATTRSRALDVEPNYGASGGLFFVRGYLVGNAGASFRVGRGLELYGRVLNVADRAYEETLGYPALRRTAMVGLRIAAGR